jgi:predicted transposase/invertase (TIGR01784 family)
MHTDNKLNRYRPSPDALLNTVFHKGDDWQTMPKVDELGDVLPETLHSEEKWCKFLVDADNPSQQDYVSRLTASDGGIMEAKKTLDKISSDWVLWKRELDREVIERDRISELHYAQGKGLKEGLKKGLQQGTLQTKREDARNFKALGVPVQTIAQATGLSEDEIAGL